MAILLSDKIDFKLKITNYAKATVIQASMVQAQKMEI